ncbi:MAG TPA: hypothetical protein VK283_11545 [Acidimicrobiales bacterium]|nr:hypothetical protein [Acidimicrobiales bacterium]
MPNKHEEYKATPQSAAGTNGGLQCLTEATIPAGDAFVVQQIEVDARGADAPSGCGSPNGNCSSSRFFVLADTAAQDCAGGDFVTSGDTPDGTVGNVAIPIAPGHVVPSGYHLDASPIEWTPKCG